MVKIDFFPNFFKLLTFLQEKRFFEKMLLHLTDHTTNLDHSGKKIELVVFAYHAIAKFHIKKTERWMNDFPSI